MERLSLLDKSKERRLKLSEAETSLYNLSANAFAKSGLAIDFEGKRLVVDINRASRHVDVSKDAVPTVKLRLKIMAMVEQSAVTVLNRNLPEVEKRLEEEFNRFARTAAPN
ncbi:hypothetical protein I8J29_00455 [Paenibacillus sp. MWE-103]|uniref:Uncharacterized protein n=1 Tax=Paenibacillus artemisiicola TaxID=1172618 RepID=A0ABS3W2W4_9BACL|nr:hypothetical protein [Paenibacillus artemisiicola]MBO7742644.1 hypothetical protein [Paenibacillus artemisiicola]